MKSKSDTQAVNRLTLLVFATLIWAVIIGGRLVHLQVLRHQSFLEQAEQQQSRIVELRAPRGTVTDRNGRPLAISLPVESVCINPMLVPDVAVASGILSPILGLDRNDFQEKMRQAAKNRRGFLWVKRKLSLKEVERLRSLKLDWIEFRKESQRCYPNGALAAHVVGAVDHQERGNAGIEQSLDQELRGRTGVARLLTDVRMRGVESEISAQAIPGEDVTLTIDERIQFVAERELEKAALEQGCNSGSLIAINPYNGEILALASYPRYNPNDPVREKTDLERRANHSISVPFEPGSVFKVITVSAALETTSLLPDTIIPCGSGSIRLFGRVIRDHDAYSSLSMADVLAKSSNIGAINIGLRVGEERLLDYVRRFGFGQTTGIPLPAESAGLVRDLEDWGKTSIGSVAMGHEISTTAIQLARAVSVIANGGLLVEPRLILQRHRPGHRPVTDPIKPARRVIKPETAITMRQLMERVVLYGTGRRARLDGYTAGGKTGSAQIFNLEQRRYTHEYNASFVGFAPVTIPAVAVVVSLNGAKKFGGVVAAPVFREVATAALRLADVPKDLPDAPPSREDEPVDFDDLAIADLGSPAPSLPEPGAPVLSASMAVWGPTVPDFRGKTMRAVLEEASARGLPVETVGHGMVRAQAPPAGTVLRKGERVRVRFAR